MSQGIQSLESQFMNQVKKNTGMTIAMGVLVMLMGIFAIASPFIAGVSITMVVGIFLIIGGIAQIIFAFKAGTGLFTIIIGVLTVIAGGYMVSNPAAALATLTIFLAAYLVVSGIYEVLVAFQAKPAAGWGWALFSGVLSIILGVMIWSQFPLSGAWAIGILLGVRLFTVGLTLMMFGMAARSAVNNMAQQ